jgi:hypothetical protein
MKPFAMACRLKRGDIITFRVIEQREPGAGGVNGLDGVIRKLSLPVHGLERRTLRASRHRKQLTPLAWIDVKAGHYNSRRPARAGKKILPV